MSNYYISNLLYSIHRNYNIMKWNSLIVIAILALALVAQAKREQKCQNIKCPKHQRCENGVCKQQNKNPKKNLCNSNDQVKSIVCKDRNFKCLGTTNVLSCGFNKDGTKFDFTDDCSPCLNKNVDFYYRLPCSQAPAVCNENEDCVNGQCVDLFSDQQFVDSVTCNLSSDCKPIIEICVANKCVNKTELMKEFKKKEKKIKKQ